ncbi:centrosomal protein of 95 kDa isoform X3 [Pitangus sulphuratus]|nr:centrosomal protein of 95 kDa isoform X3 [Pitangus sulphuratus]
MGSAEGTDWVDVANGLLRSCHINQHIKHLSECGADVFVRLYESILGEKVPDFIATPRSQEDDAHNVQAVIDSLALDYLQVSLSHITGENIVKGERESIKNLLEIFDGLLEYLTEASESSHTGAEANVLSSHEIQTASQEQLEGNTDQLTEHSIASSAEGSHAEYFLLTCDTDGSESTGELIRLGDTAHSFSRREEGWMESVPAAEPPKEGVGASATKLGEPIQQAIPLLPPFQPSHPAWRGFHSSHRQAAALASSQKIPTLEESPTEKSDDDSGRLPLSRKIPEGTVQAEASAHTSLSSAAALGAQVGDAEDNGRKVPLEHEPSTSASSSDEKFSLQFEQLTQTPRPESRYETSTTDSFEDSLSQGAAKKKLPEQELHEASEKLSRRLNELDLMLKRALGECSREELPDEDNLSQHSDSVMDYGHRTAGRVTIRDNELLVKLLQEFPSLHISHRTLNKMWERQLAHTEHLQAAPARARPKLLNEVQQALRKHELLAAIIKKDQEHRKRLQEFKTRISRQKWAQNKVTEKRQQVARARRYYEDYRVQLRAKLMRARTREEKIFKSLFEEGLEIQKQRLRDLRAYAQEKRDEQRREHQNELESMENYYKGQFAMLAEALSQEFQQIQTREKAQAQMLQKSKRELRSKMEKEIQQLQAAIMHNDDDTFFQELEADRLRSRLQMASFQYSQGHFL